MVSVEGLRSEWELSKGVENVKVTLSKTVVVERKREVG